MPPDEALPRPMAPGRSRALVLPAGRRVWLEVGLVMALAGVLRFSTLGLQSYDFDEAFTAAAVHGSFLDMLHAVARTESTPPLYYALTWVWAQVFGTGEVALRSFSALVGVALVPVVYAIGRALAPHRVGLVAGLLVATSPYLVFYSQEARSYALFALLSSVAMLCCARAIAMPTRRSVAFWAAASIAAIATHYFALFFWVGELVALAVFGTARRLLVVASAAVAVASIPLLLLARHQAGIGHVDWIGASSLSQRLRVTLETFALGATFRGSLSHSVLAVSGVLSLVMTGAIVVALVLLVGRGAGDERRAALIAGLVAVVAVALPLLAAVYRDYFLSKNLIPVLPLVAVMLAAGLGCRRAGRWGVCATVAICASGVALTVLSFAVPSMRRPDVRQMSDWLGAPTRPRVVIFVPRWQVLFEHYQGGSVVVSLPPRGRRVDEIDVFTSSASLPPGTVPSTFRLVDVRTGDTFRLFRFRSPARVVVSPDTLGHEVFSESGLQPVAVLQEPRS